MAEHAETDSMQIMQACAQHNVLLRTEITRTVSRFKLPCLTVLEIIAVETAVCRGPLGCIMQHTETNQP